MHETKTAQSGVAHLIGLRLSSLLCFYRSKKKKLHQEWGVHFLLRATDPQGIVHKIFKES